MAEKPIKRRAVEPFGARARPEYGEYIDERNIMRVCKACVPNSKAKKHTCGLSDIQDLLRF